MRKHDPGGAGSPNSREATGTAIGRETEPPNEQAIEAVAGSVTESGEAIGGSQHVGPWQGELLRGHTEILSKGAMSAALLDFVAIRWNETYMLTEQPGGDKVRAGRGRIDRAGALGRNTKCSMLPAAPRKRARILGREGRSVP